MANKATTGLTVNTSAIFGRLLESIPSTYTVWYNASDGKYYAESNVVGGTDYNDTSLSSLWGNIAVAGEKIVFRDGSFTVDAALTYYENMVIEGFGQTDDTGNLGTRLIRSGDFPIFTPDAGTLRFVDFRNLSLEGDGKGVSSSALVTMGTSCSYLKFKDVTFRKSGGVGVDMDGGSWGLSMYGCRASELTGALVSKVTPDGGSTVGLYSCVATYGGLLADLYGIRGIAIVNCSGDHWDSGAIHFQSCGGAIITGCDFEGDSVTGTTSHVIWLHNTRVKCTANRILYGGTGSSYFPIYVSAECDNAGIIEGNMVESTVANYCIGFSAAATDWKIYDNDFDKGQIAWATGKGVFRGNDTIISENSGTDTITSPATSQVVAHGLSFTPTAPMFVITLLEDPTNTPGAIWVDNIGAANFTVNCENDPGASHLDFAWSVRMDRVEP